MKELKINLGSSYYPINGFINYDIDNYGRDDIHIIDLNKESLPHKDESVDYVLISHCLEHLDKPIEMMREIHRVLKVGGIVEVRVPYYRHLSAFGVEHKWFFTKRTMEKFYGKNIYGFKFNFDRLECHSNHFPYWHMKHWLGWKCTNCRFFISELRWYLKKTKWVGDKFWKCQKQH